MSDDRAGYLYVVTHPDGFVKLGFSVNPRARASTLHCDWTLLPNYSKYPGGCRVDFKMPLTGVLRGTLGQEKELHRLFRPFRAKGTTEWYPADSVAAAIISKLGFEDPGISIPKQKTGRKPRACPACGFVGFARELRAHKCGAKQKGGK